MSSHLLLPPHMSGYCHAQSIPFEPAMSLLDVNLHVIVDGKAYHCLVTCPRSVWR